MTLTRPESAIAVSSLEHSLGAVTRLTPVQMPVQPGVLSPTTSRAHDVVVTGGDGKCPPVCKAGFRQIIDMLSRQSRAIKGVVTLSEELEGRVIALEHGGGIATAGSPAHSVGWTSPSSPREDAEVEGIKSTVETVNSRIGNLL